MGRLSDDERFEVVHAVIRDVRVDNQGGLKSPLTSLKAKIAQEAPLVVVLTSSSWRLGTDRPLPSGSQRLQRAFAQTVALMSGLG
jgi:hypothetical protein